MRRRPACRMPKTRRNASVPRCVESPTPAQGRTHGGRRRRRTTRTNTRADRDPARAISAEARWAMCSLAIAMIPAAASSADMRRDAATRSTADSREIGMDLERSGQTQRRRQAAEHDVRVRHCWFGAAAPVARGTRRWRRPIAGRRAARRPSSRYAIDPPPEAIVWISAIGTATGYGSDRAFIA